MTTPHYYHEDLSTPPEPAERPLPGDEIGEPVLEDGRVYSGDNGALFCGAHAGMSARYTGYDISGHAVKRLTWREVADLQRLCGVKDLCERCREVA